MLGTTAAAAAAAAVHKMRARPPPRLTTSEPAAPQLDEGRLSAKPVESPEADTMASEPKSLATATDAPGSRLRIRSVKAPESVSATPVT